MGKISTFPMQRLRLFVLICESRSPISWYISHGLLHI